jgi:C-terminal processing protease CtpA/Prc
MGTSTVASDLEAEQQSEAGALSETGETMSYAYSLDPGNVDQATTAGSTAVDKSSKKSAGGTSGGSQSGDEMSSHAMSSLRQNMVSRTVVAPPGKLGIVIDTTLEGPVVHKVNPQSPLEGSLFPGDIIVAIDDVDTRAMSASAITALMVRTANMRRKLTVLSEDIAS